MALSVNLKCKQYKGICFPVMFLLVHKDEEPNQSGGKIIRCQSPLVDSWVPTLPGKDGRQRAVLARDKENFCPFDFGIPKQENSVEGSLNPS